MKRIKAACICQTLHFQCKENTDQTYAGKVVREEVEHYKHQLDRSCTKYRILSEVEQSDGSIMLKIIKQYNRSPLGEYLDVTETK